MKIKTKSVDVSLMQNTLPEFRKCVQQLEAGEPLSEDEFQAAKKIYNLAQDLVDLFPEGLPLDLERDF